MTDRQVLVRVSGKVQGVWFRAWTKGEAEKRGLDGWVRNEADGSVTALFSGPAAQVDAMLAALWRGPPAAQVADVSLETTDNQPVSKGFVVTG